MLYKISSLKTLHEFAFEGNPGQSSRTKKINLRILQIPVPSRTTVP